MLWFFKANVLRIMILFPECLKAPSLDRSYLISTLTTFLNPAIHNLQFTRMTRPFILLRGAWHCSRVDCRDMLMTSCNSLVIVYQFGKD